ncbi:arsenate-mycothiol transferase ArsC [Robiginitomaculum antarcticum]|uniref:arsenate-mycothiol transferase ArsC n=1 Tax=Robiginitomaculum antarcticum TaxID=437507 RepID=UPI0003618133|nr:low molecular weight phosphatase family protein [Robiginitomaculum antarcticum]
MKKPPSSILFICQLNSIRSPMAEALMRKHYGARSFADSCGVYAGDLDDFMVSVLAEQGMDMSGHEAQSLAQLQDSNFDAVIAFTPNAFEAAKTVFEDTETKVTHWPMPDPTQGSLDVRALMDNYRSVREMIKSRLVEAFGPPD